MHRVWAVRIAFWLLNGFLLGVCALSVFRLASMWWLVPAVFAHLALMFSAALWSQAQIFARVIWRGKAGRGAVSLTFDDGPDPRTTPRILELLRREGHTATFFVIGNKVERYPELTRQIVAEGHTLGLHSYDHDRLYAFKSPRAVVADVERTQRIIQSATGVTTSWLRPPVGQVSPRTAKGAALAHVELVTWSTRGFDGVRRARSASVARRIIRKLADGAVILMHDAAERGDFVPAALEALPEVQTAISRRGLKVIPLRDLCAPEGEAQ